MRYANDSYCYNQGRFVPDGGWDLEDRDLIGHIRPFLDRALYNDDLPALRRFVHEQLLTTTDKVRTWLDMAEDDAEMYDDDGYLSSAIREMALEQYGNHLTFRININKHCLANYREQLEELAKN